jgi:hypothetical protein
MEIYDGYEHGEFSSQESTCGSMLIDSNAQGELNRH